MTKKEVIEVSGQTYKRLIQKMVRFEDTPDTVIARLLDESAYRATEPRSPESGPIANGAEGPAAPHRKTGKTSSIVRTSANGVEGSTAPRPGGEGPPVDFSFHDVFEPPSDLLKHTRVRRAEVDGREVAGANWTRVRQSVVTIALDQLGYDLHRLLEFCPMNAVVGVKTDEGYTHYPKLGVSIQGQDAKHAWQAAAAMARELGLSVQVWFQWRAKSDAKHPGKRGIVTIGQELAPHQTRAAPSVGQRQAPRA